MQPISNLYFWLHAPNNNWQAPNIQMSWFLTWHIEMSTFALEQKKKKKLS